MNSQAAKPTQALGFPGVLLGVTLALISPPATCTLVAQSATTGAIRCNLVDSAGGSIQSAEITLSATNQTPRHLQVAASSGSLLIPAIPPGEYTLDVGVPGSQPMQLLHVVVEIGGTTQVRLKWPALHMNEQVTVEANELEGLDDAGPVVSTVITSQEIARLPLRDRSWQELALLTPEATPGDAGETGLLSFRAFATNQNASRLDGAVNDQSFTGTPHGSGSEGGTGAGDDAEMESQSSSEGSGRGFSFGSGEGRRPGAAIDFAQEAVREFRVMGQNYSAMYGHAAGGVITTVSRGGTDVTHGSAFYLRRESAWDATNPFSIATHYNAGAITEAVVKPEDRRHQFGGSLGGPIAPSRYPHRFFYFYAFEGQRRSFPAVSSPETSSFYALTAVQRALLGTRGVSGAKVDEALQYLDSLTGVVPRSSNQSANFLRLDAHLTSRSQISVQYNRARFSSPFGLRSAPVVNRALRSFGSQSIDVDSLLSRWTYSRRSIFSNELRVHYSRDHHDEKAESPLEQEPAIANGGLAPEVAIGPQGFYYGTPASVGKGAAPDEHRFQVSQVATLSYRRSLLQIGFDYNFVRDTTDLLSSTAGSFHYDSGATNGRAGGLVDWITDYTFNVGANPNGGCPNIHASTHYFCFRSFSQNFGVRKVIFATQEFAGFVQQRWRPSNRLSLSAGLRYEYELLPLPQHPNSFLDATFLSRGATSIFPEDRNNLGPRISAAWQPFGGGGMILRLAYGLYFGRLPGATVRAALANTATTNSQSRIRILPTTITACPQVTNQGFGFPCTFNATPPSGVTSTTSAIVFDRRFRVPMSQQGSATVERDIHHLLTVSAGYLVSITHQLPNSEDINVAPATETRLFQLQGGNHTIGVRSGDTFLLPVYTRRVSSDFGPVTAITSNVNGSYNAFVVQARHRSRHGLELRTSWTWSKSLDFGQTSGSVPHVDGQFDPFNVRYDKGLSLLNIPHKFVASAVWSLGSTSGTEGRKKFGSGWTLAPVLTESAGHPYSYEIFGGMRLNGGNESINGSGGERYLPTVGRNTLRLPDSFDLSLRAARDIRLTDKLHLQLVTEAFNLTNHVNYTSTTERAFLVGPTSAGITPLIFQDAQAIAAEGLTSRPFGAFTSSSSDTLKERQLQFGIRLDF